MKRIKKLTEIIDYSESINENCTLIEKTISLKTKIIDKVAERVYYYAKANYQVNITKILGIYAFLLLYRNTRKTSWICVDKNELAEYAKESPRNILRVFDALCEMGIIDFYKVQTTGRYAIKLLLEDNIESLSFISNSTEKLTLNIPPKVIHRIFEGWAAKTKYNSNIGLPIYCAILRSAECKINEPFYLQRIDLERTIMCNKPTTISGINFLNEIGVISANYNTSKEKWEISLLFQDEQPSTESLEPQPDINKNLSDNDMEVKIKWSVLKTLLERGEKFYDDNQQN